MLWERKGKRPRGVIFQIVDRSVLLVESTINYNNLPFFIEVKLNT
jgi:hypothetical protein